MTYDVFIIIGGCDSDSELAHPGSRDPCFDRPRMWGQVRRHAQTAKIRRVGCIIDHGWEAKADRGYNSMTRIAESGLVILASGLLGLGFWRFAVAIRKFRGKRLVTCPESGEPAAVDLTTWHAAWTAVFRRPTLRLRDCSQWRTRPRCGQPCLSQIQAAPEDCLIRNLLTKWYEGKSCVCCGKPVGKIDWLHKPCFMSPQQRIYEWEDIQPEKLPLALKTHQPVCWICLVAETHVL